MNAVKSLVAMGVLATLSGMAHADEPTPVWWTGAQDNNLANDANWEGDVRPNASGMAAGFKNQPSTDYTLTLTNDLSFVCPWWFDRGAQRHTFDLAGHTLTFQSEYSWWYDENVTNVIKNGTIAFTNQTGEILEVTSYGGTGGYSLIIGENGAFVGDVQMVDDGRRYLTVEKGGRLRGGIRSVGTDSRVDIRDPGTMCDVASRTFSIGGAGQRTRAFVTDGATVKDINCLYVGGDTDNRTSTGNYLCVSNATLTMRNEGEGNFFIGNAYVAEWDNKSRVSQSNRMDVIGGAHVEAGGNHACVGHGSSNGSVSNGNLLYVAGEGTTFSNLWANSDRPWISGRNGTGNQIHVTDNAFLYASYISAGGQEKWPDFHNFCYTSMWNRVTVDGGATIQCDCLQLATRHDDDSHSDNFRFHSLNCSNVVEVLEGGTLQVKEYVQCGEFCPGFGNAVVVRGPGALLDVSGDPKGDGSCTIGAYGSPGNHLEVTDGGRLNLVGDLNIGGDKWGNLNITASNNWARIDGCAITNESKGLYVGSMGNANCRLWLGTGSSFNFQECCLMGENAELIVSNATLSVQSVTVTRPETKRPKISFYGVDAKLLTVRQQTWTPITNNTVFAFHVPAGGYASAPFESTWENVNIGDDTQFEFDFSALRGEGVRTTLFEINSSFWDHLNQRIIISQETLDRMQAAACAQVPGSKIEVEKLSGSEIIKKISLKVPRRGFIVILR